MLNPLELESRHIETHYWITLILLGIFILLALAKSLYPKRFNEFIQLPITDKYFSLEGKNHEIRHPFNILLFSVQVLSFSIFIYIYFLLHSPDMGSRPWLFLQIISGFTLFVTFKYYLEKLVAYVLNIEAIVDRYLYEKLNYGNLISLFIWILALILYFSIPPNGKFMNVAIALIILLYLISLVSSAKRNGSLILRNFFYFILYLCALEIAPYIILYSVLV